MPSYLCSAQTYLSSKTLVLSACLVHTVLLYYSKAGFSAEKKRIIMHIQCGSDIWSHILKWRTASKMKVRNDAWHALSNQIGWSFLKSLLILHTYLFTTSFEKTKCEIKRVGSKSSWQALWYMYVFSRVFKEKIYTYICLHMSYICEYICSQKTTFVSFCIKHVLLCHKIYVYDQFCLKTIQ